jgi:transcriptional regulator NrdR family protein
MNCLKCKGNAGVIDTLHYKGIIYRRRKCKECGHTFYTEERVSEDKTNIRAAINFKKLKSVTNT